MTFAEAMYAALEASRLEKFPAVKNIYLLSDTRAQESCYILLDPDAERHTDAGGWQSVKQKMNIVIFIVVGKNPLKDIEKSVSDLAITISQVIQEDLRLGNFLVENGIISDIEAGQTSINPGNACFRVIYFDGKFMRKIP